MAVWPLVVALLCCIYGITSTPLGNNVCVVGGKVYQEGDTFPVPEMGGKCTQYKCHQGGYKEFKLECEDRLGICKPLNAKETVNCVTKQCLTGDSGTIFYIQTESKITFIYQYIHIIFQ
ncbi:hypothetical protein SNE40_019522 [Patella caerulea]|uniref:Uncharacterized protein n=1 Tax=Patella caerulea TaxID=87958 RepID=A0AAN8JBB9_PATCE